MFLAVITCVTLWCAYVFVNVYFCGTDNILGFIRKNFKFQSVCLCEGVWAHGDHCLINPNTGGIWMLGRRLALPIVGTITCIFVCIWLSWYTVDCAVGDVDALTFTDSRFIVFASDGTLNPRGDRFGSAEIYHVGQFRLVSFLPDLLRGTSLFSALILLLGHQEEHVVCKKFEWWGAGIVICLDWGKMICVWCMLMPLPPHRLLLY